MFWAIVDNQKKEATPKTKGLCPFCNEKVRAKCGNINVWHWAHVGAEDCDSWHEPETFWHKHWKMTFGKENAEKRITKSNKWHVADILTNNTVVIELQNSRIAYSVIAEREKFYGNRMIWLINGEGFKKNLKVQEKWVDKEYLEWKSMPQKPVRWIRKTPEIKKGKNGEFFRWKHPLKSWLKAKRPIFLDLGDDTLFRVIEGMGTFQLRGKYVTKQKFMQKYGGDYEYFRQHLI